MEKPENRACPVLVAFDGSPCSDGAVSNAIELAPHQAMGAQGLFVVDALEVYEKGAILRSNRVRVLRHTSRPVLVT